MDLIEIDPAVGRERRLFCALPFRLAEGHPAWRPGIRRLHEDLVHPSRNPFWMRHRGSFFVAVRGGRVEGRMAVVDPGQLPEMTDAAVLAFPDFVDAPAVVDTLFSAVRLRARERGARRLVGPLNPNIHHDVGIQVDAFERPNAVLMGYQPSYYRAHFERVGFEKLADFEAWGLYQDSFAGEGRLQRLASRVLRRPELRIRTVRLKAFQEELGIFFDLYCRAFADHWGFAAPSREEFDFLASDLRYLLRERMALVAEWEGRPVGFVLGIPDVYSILPRGSRGRLTPGLVIRVARRWRSIEEVRVMIAGVLPEYRPYGIHLPLFHRIAREIFDLGYRGGEISWVHGTNDPMAKVLPLLGASRTKTYRLYASELHQ